MTSLFSATSHRAPGSGVTLEDDVAALLKRAQARTKKSLKQLVNEALRHALTTDGPRAAEQHTPYQTSVHHAGRCLVGSLECVADALSIAEGEDFK